MKHREKWEAGGMSITTWTEGDTRCFVCYKPGVSIFCQTSKEVLQFAAWPASLPTGANLRSWLASLGAADHQRNLEQDAVVLKATGFSEHDNRDLLKATGFGPEQHEDDDPTATTKMIT
jgi:hypothetical protein